MIQDFTCFLIFSTENNLEFLKSEQDIIDFSGEKGFLEQTLKGNRKYKVSNKQRTRAAW